MDETMDEKMMFLPVVVLQARRPRREGKERGKKG